MRKNILFNFISRLFAAISTFLFVPFYVSILGTDGYSIIALSLVVLSLVLIMEIGLTAAISREMARRDISDAERRKAFTVIEHIFLIFLSITIVSGCTSSSWLALHILADSAIDVDILITCLKFIIIEAGFQLLMRFYIGVMIGLERQMCANLFTILWTALRNGLVIVVIWHYPDLRAFFGWQLAVTFFIVGSLKLYSLNIVRAWPQSAAPFLDWITLGRLRGFASGMLLISLVAVINTQMDRIFIGSMVAMRDLGAYVLAATVGAAILIGSTPILMAVQPRLTRMFTNGEADEARVLHERASRFIALLVFPPAMIVSINPRIVLHAWIGQPDLAQSASALVPFLVFANVFIALATISHGAALANGYTRFNNLVGISSIFVSMPGYFLAIRYFGISGVAAVYMGVQLASTFFLSFLVMNQFFGGGVLRHYIVNFSVPGIGALIGTILHMKFATMLDDSRLQMAIYLLEGVIISGAITIFLSLGIWKVVDKGILTLTPSKHL